jgi:hypothetical protein
VDDVALGLKAGFKWISSACNETRVIFSDDPKERTDSKRDLYRQPISPVTRPCW